MTQTRQSPEGALIGKAIDASPSLSRRGVAEAIGMSEARVRQIINGYASAGRGQTVQVIAPAATLARLAAAVGVSAEALTAAGRPDAANEMQEQRKAAHGRGVILDSDSYERALAAMEAWIGDSDPDGEVHPPASTLWLYTPRQLADNLAEQVAALEAAQFDASRRYFQLLTRGKRGEDNETEITDDRDTAPTTRAGESPADQLASRRTAAEAEQQPESAVEREAAREAPPGGSIRHQWDIAHGDDEVP